MGTFTDMITSNGKGATSTYRPAAGTVCLVSGPNCDDDNGFTFTEMKVEWRDDIFVLFKKPGCWPVINKWDHVICRPTLVEKFTADVDQLISSAESAGLGWEDIAAELEGLARIVRQKNRETP